MNCIIIEDEKVAAERLRGLLSACDASLEIKTIIPSIKKAVEYFKSVEKVDLVFMDIHLADGLCFEIFDQVKVNLPVIFTTAYDEYALKAFKVNSIDYLLKPIDGDELCNALEKFKSSMFQKKIIYPKEIIEDVIQALQGGFKNKFVIKVGEHIRVIQIIDVNCFYSLEKATFLQTKEKREYALNYSLEQLEEMVDPKTFFRINRQYIIAFSSIIDIIAFSNSRLRLKLKNLEDMEIIVSRERVQQFREWIEQ
jgi:DNA-binding LytR/AlgR family response regulator